ncbi:hypothetical protein VTK73DRAFT_7536 [Phialemonium thermophilum]|uniref:Formamidopyrimidine-DNA glycosylase H2TH DNA-binding domain-containing protein n=1 Tax=Phialemonium thermophilum TaxID=223376 RepID=A0ABR3WEA3_9PEZI
MTGWIHIKGEKTAYTNYYNKLKEGEKDVWPPKFWKFHLETVEPSVRVAYTDPRRFGRVRLVDCPGKDIRKHSPLVENGPDPVVDKDVFTEGFLRQKMKARHVPIKALLLDQTTLSGVGNWVADEVLYQARLHPEQYCDEFSDQQIAKLYETIRYVCQFAVDKLGDSDQFPKDWLFHYRWDSRPSAPKSRLPNGEKLAFLKVGGRTSCYAPNLQKNTGHIVPGVKEEPIPSDVEDEMVGKGKRKAKKPAKKPEVEDDEDQLPPKKPSRKQKAEDDEDELPPKKRKTRGSSNGVTKNRAVQVAVQDAATDENRRRSGRLRGKRD